MDLGSGRERDRNELPGSGKPGAVLTARISPSRPCVACVRGYAFHQEPVGGPLVFPAPKAHSPLSGTRMTQESFRENSMKELGRLEGQLAGLRQELAALALKQSSVADQVGLLPQQLQAVRDDVSPSRPGPLLSTCPLRPSVLGVCRGQFPAPAALVPRGLALDLTQMLSSCVGRHS